MNRLELLALMSAIIWTDQYTEDTDDAIDTAVRLLDTIAEQEVERAAKEGT